MATFDPSNYSLILVQRSGPRPWAWAIRKAGNKHPIQRSTRGFATADEAQTDGGTALGGLLEILETQHARRARGGQPPSE